jgi:hypothetical protein
MSALEKKEIRLLLPGAAAAALMSAVQVLEPYGFYAESLLFLGMAIMALTTIGREASLNTFSAMLAQPIDRAKLWTVKLTVLAVAFLLVIAVWLIAVAIGDSNWEHMEPPKFYNQFVVISLLAMATFTGGLWTTLLLRQLAGAFWLTILVPAMLIGTVGLVNSDSDSLIIAVLVTVIGIYSLVGFLFARWLFFRAQDIGWSGGVIALPEWRFLARRGAVTEARTSRPLFTLFKKELQLQQGVLTGAIGLLVLHVAIILVRVFHHFAKDSAGEVLTNLVWVLWFLMPVLMGSMAVAEERKLGVMETQLCLPVSRRLQFMVKSLTTLGLGIFLGAVMPLGLELLGAKIGTHSPMFSDTQDMRQWWFIPFFMFVIASVALTLVTLFASSLAKSFLTALGAALVTCAILMFGMAMFTNHHMLFYDSIAPYSILPLVIAVPTFAVTLVWLAYLNYRNSREGWPLWRRQLLAFGFAIALVGGVSSALYHRVWEVFEPAEPAHGPARLSLANPPALHDERDENLLVRLPDGRVWFDFLTPPLWGDYGQHLWLFFRHFWSFAYPLPRSAGPRRYLSGSGWVDASAHHFADSVGIQPDGTLWVSDTPLQNVWAADHLTQFGSESNWQALVRGDCIESVLLLKKNGTLWHWGTNHIDYHGWLLQDWPGLRAFEPYQIGTNSDWKAFYLLNGVLVRKTDGSDWRVWVHGKDYKDELIRETNYDDIVTERFAACPYGNSGAYVRKDGTLWAYGDVYYQHGHSTYGTFVKRQVSRETNWVAVARTQNGMVSLKADGTLWQWERVLGSSSMVEFHAPARRLGIHSDWVAVTAVEGGIIALAADGSLWFWPDRQDYEYDQWLIRLPKQPIYIGNVFKEGK